MSDDHRNDAWASVNTAPALGETETHVWRVSLERTANDDAQLAVMSDDERERVRRFYFPRHGVRYATAHSALRLILAQYTDRQASELSFAVGEHGKPELTNARTHAGQYLHFNLSHSGDLALVAVSLNGPVGVDVEQWRERIQHHEVAERFFSPYERDQIRLYTGDHSASERLLRGFFSTWSRKEAYLKATGHGISRGLHHFDVTMATHADDAGAELLADRLDPQAVERWMLHNISVGPGYSAAVVTTRHAAPEAGAIRLFESPYM